MRKMPPLKGEGDRLRWRGFNGGGIILNIENVSRPQKLVALLPLLLSTQISHLTLYATERRLSVFVFHSDGKPFYYAKFAF